MKDFCLYLDKRYYFIIFGRANLVDSQLSNLDKLLGAYRPYYFELDPKTQAKFNARLKFISVARPRARPNVREASYCLTLRPIFTFKKISLKILPPLWGGSSRVARGAAALRQRARQRLASILFLFKFRAAYARARLTAV